MPYQPESTDQTGKLWIIRLLLDKISINTNQANQASFAVGIFGLSLIQLVPLTTDAIASLAFIAGVPLQVDAVSSSLCEAGVGNLITIGLWIISMVLLLKSIPQLYRGFDERGKRSGKAQRQSGEHFSSAMIMVIGSVIVATMPTLLSAAGFSLLSCVDSVPIL